MRIINGIYKGRSIPVFKNLKARPTTDFAKESLFNILQNQIDLENIKVLDLFGGTGSIGLEFCSRGAAQVNLVEFNKNQVRHISKIAAEWEAPLKAIHIDVFEFIKISKESYDIIFADPPYDHKSIGQIPDAILEKGLLKDDGLLIVEHGKHTSLSDHPHFLKTKKYGQVHFTFFTTFKNKSHD